MRCCWRRAARRSTGTRTTAPAAPTSRTRCASCSTMTEPMAARVEHRRVRVRTAVPPRPAPPRARTVGLLLGLVAVLDVIGLVMVLSASSVTALRAYGTAWVFFERQLLWVGVGSLLLVLTMRVDYRVWRRLVVPLLGVTVTLLV